MPNKLIYLDIFQTELSDIVEVGSSPKSGIILQKFGTFSKITYGDWSNQISQLVPKFDKVIINGF